MKTLTLRTGETVMMDDLDFEWAQHYKWYLDPEGYVRATTVVNNHVKNKKLHTWIHGGPASFRDGNKLNCQRDNLKDYVNTGGSGRPRKSAGPPGVYEYKGKFTLNVYVKGKSNYLGRFATMDEAIAAREAFLKEQL